MTCTPREIITRPPSRRRGESAADYRERLAEWERDRLQANASGYRQISLPPGVSPMGRALLVSIAALSYAQGFEYHPIELSERAVAALLRLKNSRANHQARSVLAELLAIGILVVVEPARGRRPGQYHLEVAPIQKKHGRAREKNGRNRSLRPLSTPASSPARPDPKKEKKDREGQPSAPPAPARPMGVKTGGAPPGSKSDNRPMSLGAYLASLTDDEREELEQSTGFGIVNPVFGGGRGAGREKPGEKPKQSQSVLLPPQDYDPAEHQRRVRAQAAHFRSKASMGSDRDTGAARLEAAS